MNKITNTLKYRASLFKSDWLRKVKYRNIHNKIIKDLAVRDEIYFKMKKKYSKYVTVSDSKSPNNTSNKVWICWLQGRETAPGLIRKCIETAEKKLKDCEVIILTWDNYKKYVTFPDYIIEKFERKIIPMAHFSDLLRLNVLINHGGLWIDSTVLCACDGIPDYMKCQPLFMYKEVNLNRNDEMPTVASNWLIYAGANNNILTATRDMLYAFWKDVNALNDYFIFHILFKVATEIYSDEWDAVPSYNNVNPHMLQFELNKEYNDKRWEQLINMSDFHKLNRHIERDNSVFTNYEFILNNFKKNKKNKI